MVGNIAGVSVQRVLIAAAVGALASGCGAAPIGDELTQADAPPSAPGSDYAIGQVQQAITTANWTTNGNTGAGGAGNAKLGLINTTGGPYGLELWVKPSGVTATRALVIDTANPPNLIGGYNVNAVTAGVVGAVISGGGDSTYGQNLVTDSGGVISGGSNNLAGDATGTTDTAAFATVSGGAGNQAKAFLSTIGGGNGHVTTGQQATIGGGAENLASAQLATVGGGYSNEANGSFCIVGGGSDNGCSDEYSTVGGGLNNQTAGNFSTVAGGSTNSASNLAAFVGGGDGNTASAREATIAGGSGNGVSTDGGFVGGGIANGVSGINGVVSGGYLNSATNSYATISGGTENIASGPYAAVGGGYSNEASGTIGYSTIGGGDNNTASGSYSTVGGGSSNEASWDNAFVGGGSSNKANTAGAVVAGGVFNTAGGGIGNYPAVLGGTQNTASGGAATVVGGASNTASGANSVVLGGYGNTASGAYTLSAGQNANANFAGCFVWADNSTSTVLNCGAANKFVARAAGGVVFYSNSGATAGVQLTAGANAWAAVSDRNAKKDFVRVEPKEVLERVASMPISTWTYKSEPGVRHMGPMAQDFRAAFGLGTDDRSIVTIDADGVALTAIQGLNEKVKELETTRGKLEDRLASLTTQNQDLQKRIERLEAGAPIRAAVAPGGQWAFLATALGVMGALAIGKRRHRGRF